MEKTGQGEAIENSSTIAFQNTGECFETPIYFKIVDYMKSKMTHGES